MTDANEEQMSDLVIPRFDARLVTDACGNKDVLMKERHDGLFVRFEDHEKALATQAQQIVKLQDAEEYGNEMERRWDAAEKKQAELDTVIANMLAELARLRIEIERLKKAQPTEKRGWSEYMKKYGREEYGLDEVQPGDARIACLLTALRKIADHQTQLPAEECRRIAREAIKEGR